MSEREQEVQALQAMTHRQLCDWYRQHLSAQSSHRKRLAVHVVGRAHASEVQTEVGSSVQLIRDLEAFQTAAEWHMPQDGLLPALQDFMQK